MATVDRLRTELRETVPFLDIFFEDTCERLLSTDAQSQKHDQTVINDTIWKNITVSPLETAVLDTPLMQRLRRIRQLGLADVVYPGAHHTRLEHSLGVMHVAGRMFRHMAEEVHLPDDQRAEAYKIVRLAGLLHDCGHMLFSHVAERALEDLFKDAFSAIEDILQKHLDAPIRYTTPTNNNVSEPKSKTPRFAEILSALFVLSPAMENLFDTQGGISTPTKESLVLIAGLIFGRPGSLVFGEGRSLQFMKSIITGDLDADKIDYVARDGYYAGIPLAVDVERLLSQLIPIRIDRDTRIQGLKAELSERQREYYLLGLKPTGASAMEMLVLTRAYLFERIYGHHKVRATERLVERVFRQSLPYYSIIQRDALDDWAGWSEAKQEEFLKEPESLKHILDFMLQSGGDDSALSEIAQLSRRNHQPELEELANSIMCRNLPLRSLPIAPRYQVGFTTSRRSLSPMTRTRWPAAKRALGEASGQYELEDRICELSDLTPGRDVIVDWTQRNPISEDPDIWVRATQSGIPERISKHFNVQQLSNAYQEIKETGWIFASSANRHTVAAAAGVALAERFGLVPNDFALSAAKLSPSKYDKEVNGIGTKYANLLPMCDRLCSREESDFLEIFEYDVFDYVPYTEDIRDRRQIANALAAGLTACRLPITSSADVQEMLPLLGRLLNHCQLNNNRLDKWANNDKDKEKGFQRELEEYLVKDGIYEDFSMFEEINHQHGRIDLAFHSQRVAHLKFVLELKSSKDSFNKSVAYHAGQSFEYLSQKYSRVCIMYCQFGGQESIKLSDAITVRTNLGTTSNLAAICIGHRAYGKKPSQSGRHSAKPKSPNRN